MSTKAKGRDDLRNKFNGNFDANPKWKWTKKAKAWIERWKCSQWWKIATNSAEQRFPSAVKRKSRKKELKIKIVLKLTKKY
jgi:hypothetical protein